ncbi:MAG TPA: aminotransferase class I/II-fold pyridoxal phosphate-dependent enzyme [Blastocatellia bacterium]|nr:aminotransferase class I/II-fold pyridoxal phosphate-dependent enzyme [Blastocatellia bacterium]
MSTNQTPIPKGWHSRGYLPHFDGGELSQFVTIRLFDSVPPNVLERWKAELDQQEPDESERIKLLHRKIETYADQGFGECWLRRPEIAELVEQCLLHFDGERYRLSAWVVMPNHVHFVLTPLPGHGLSQILQSLKTWTANRANELLQRTGRFWMPDYFDRYIRDTKHFADVVAYIERNPVKAKLCAEAGDWRFGSAWQRKSKGKEAGEIDGIADGDVRGPAGWGSEEVGVPAMFSSRFKWSLETNRLSQLIAEQRQAGVRIFDLTESNPTRAGFEFPTSQILAALANPAAMLYEPQAKGLLVAREAVAAYYAERGFVVDVERIHLTASTSEAYSFLFKLLANHGDNVLVPQPSYPLFDFLASLEGVELRPYELEHVPSGWKIDFDSIERAVTPTTRAIILVSPNNPTGSFLKREELQRLNELCIQHNLALIVDEVFSDYAFGDDARRVASLVENASALTFVMSGFSKILALPQMKLGWIVTNGPDGVRDEAIERLDLIADTFLSVGAPVQHAAGSWFEVRAGLQRQILDRVKINHDWLAAHVEHSPVRMLPAEGGWYAALEVPRHSSEEELVLQLLAEDHVLVHPGYFFDFPREAFLVLSLLPKTDEFREAVTRILNRIF